MYKKLTDCSIYQMYDRTMNLSSKVPNLITSSRPVKKDDVQENLFTIERRFHFTSKPVILDNYYRDRFLIVTNENQSMRIPSTIPFIYFPINDNMRCVVNASNYIKINKDGNFNVDNKELYCLMSAGSISLSYYTTNYYNQNSEIITYGSYMYTAMLNRILDTLYSIRSNQMNSDAVTYLVGLFYLTNMLGMDFITTTKNYALKNCNTLTLQAGEIYLNKFKKEDFSSFINFIKSLARTELLPKAEVGQILNKYTSLYGSPMMLAIEYYPYFLYNISIVEVGANLNNERVIELVCGKRNIAMLNKLLYVTI